MPFSTSRRGFFFSLVLTFITSLASSNLLPSNYPFFSSASPGRAQVIRKVPAGTRSQPCLGAGGSRQGHRGKGRDTEQGHRHCPILQVSQHPQLRGKSTGATGTPNFVPNIQRKAKTRSYFKLPYFEDHLSTNFQNLVPNTISSHQYFK